jgi:hypothetical protein
MGLLLFVWLAVALPIAGWFREMGHREPFITALCWPLGVLYACTVLPLITLAMAFGLFTGPPGPQD